MNLEVGQAATRELTVTPAMVRSYAEIPGDYNPLHFDGEVASRTRFDRLIAQGGIAMGLLHALVAMDLPDAEAVFTKQDWTFPSPVYIGDTICAEGRVVSVHRRLPMAEMECTVTNQAGAEVLKGTATVFQAEPKGLTGPGRLAK